MKSAWASSQQRWASYLLGWRWLLTLLLGLPGLEAHRPSDAWLQLTVTNRSVTVRLDLSLKDLDPVLGLDTSDDGKLTWGELRRREPDLVEYVVRRLTLTNSSERLLLVPEPLRLVDHEEVVCASLLFTAEATAELTQLTLTYRCLFELDPQHRALVQAAWAGAAVTGATNSSTNQLISAASFTGLLSPAEPSVTFICNTHEQNGRHHAPTHAFSQFFWEGVHHIWTGYDHLLFLTALLLPAVLRRGRTGWEPAGAFPPALFTVLKVVTAFTIAHSITLALAAFGLARPPSRMIESAIAASVLYAALSNLITLRSARIVPSTNDPRSTLGRVLSFAGTVPFSFGLIHGFGFANALGELGLSGAGLAVPLIAFNLGVESGQLICVALFLPAAFALRTTSFYRRGILPFGSALIALIAAAWLVDRITGHGFMPF